MNIAMIGHKRVPSREGGVEIAVWELASRFQRGGDMVTVYNRREHSVKKPDTRRYIDGIRVIRIPTFVRRSLNAIVYSILASFRALFGGHDVIHYHAEGPCIMLWLPRLFGIPVVATIHGLDWQRAKWGNFASKMLKYGEKTAALKADEVIVLSANMQQYFLDTYGRETRFIPNGVGLPERKEAQLITEKFGLEKDGYILFLARLVPEKGIHYLIDAYRQLPADVRRGVKLVIAGGEGSAGDYVSQLQERASGDPDILFTGFVKARMLEELYSNCRIFVLPSDVEGMSIGLLEAMSYGCCTVVSDIPENLEVVEDHAVSFRKGDTGDLAAVLEGLLRDESRRKSLAEAASSFITRKYSWDDAAGKTKEVYEAAMAKHPGREKRRK